MTRPVAPAPGSRLDRARGALWGLALGDALGMPTQELPREAAAALAAAGPWPRLAAAGPDQPVASGLSAGSVTDDTEQAVLLGQLLLAGRLSPAGVAAALTEWADTLAARGRTGLLGPSTSVALAAVAAGADPATTGRAGTTNGAAMRAAPLGIARSARPMGPLLELVVAAGRVTHDTGIAHAGAAAVAAAVSAGVDGADVPAALEVAVRVARRAQRCGAWAAGPSVAARVAWAVGLVRDAHGVDEALDLVDTLVGTSVATTQSVPAALALAALTPDDAWLAAGRAASLGGDADTVAAMAGAVVGACTGAAALPREAVATVAAATPGLAADLDALAVGLLALRDAAP